MPGSLHQRVPLFVESAHILKKATFFMNDYANEF
jgi:hypothetical protein